MPFPRGEGVALVPSDEVENNDSTPHQSASLTAVSSPDSVSAKRVMADHSAPLKGKP